MKYMGSKRAMLKNGLGSLLDLEVSRTSRFVDLFSGSGAVACFVAQRHEIPVHAFDLQEFGAVLAGAVEAIDAQRLWKTWTSRALRLSASPTAPTCDKLTIAAVQKARKWCGDQQHLPITRAYGGHYFSPQQSISIDLLRAALPEAEPQRTVALAALIQAASQCVAAPGHTAQPFQPTETAMRYLQEAWERDVAARVQAGLSSLAEAFALREGTAKVGEANEAAEELRKGDVAFIDPPYSGVHYSRFYHVLETIAHGGCGDVSGVGRYPAEARRPKSRFSIKSQSHDALEYLLQTISSAGAKAIMTFPDHECSNGLSGEDVRDIAAEHFHVTERVVQSKFSTLGGSSSDAASGTTQRGGRRLAKELVLLLEPR